MNKQSQRIQHLGKLLRLQRSRIAAAEAEYRVSQSAHNKIKEAMEQRQARIERIKQQRDRLINHGIEHDVSELARFAVCISARRKWLDYDLEKDEYWLKDDQRELNEAAIQVEKMRSLWLQARFRETGIQKLLNEARHNETRETEHRLETEATEFVPSGLRSLHE